MHRTFPLWASRICVISYGRGTPAIYALQNFPLWRYKRCLTNRKSSSVRNAKYMLCIFSVQYWILEGTYAELLVDVLQSCANVASLWSIDNSFVTWRDSSQLYFFIFNLHMLYPLLYNSRDWGPHLFHCDDPTAESQTLKCLWKS